MHITSVQLCLFWQQLKVTSSLLMYMFCILEFSRNVSFLYIKKKCTLIRVQWACTRKYPGLFFVLLGFSHIFFFFFFFLH